MFPSYINRSKFRTVLLLLSLFFIGVFCIILLPTSIVHAQSMTDLVPCGDPGEAACTFKDFFELMNRVIKFLIFQFGVVVVTIVIIWAGVLYVLYPYKPGYKETAKKMMWSAVGGLLIMMGAYLIVKTVVTSVIGPASNDANPTEKQSFLEAIGNIFSDLPDTTQE